VQGVLDHGGCGGDVAGDRAETCDVAGDRAEGGGAEADDGDVVSVGQEMVEKRPCPRLFSEGVGGVREEPETDQVVEVARHVRRIPVQVVFPGCVAATLTLAKRAREARCGRLWSSRPRPERVGGLWGVR